MLTWAYNSKYCSFVLWHPHRVELVLFKHARSSRVTKDLFSSKRLLDSWTLFINLPSKILPRGTLGIKINAWHDWGKISLWRGIQMWKWNGASWDKRVERPWWAVKSRFAADVESGPTDLRVAVVSLMNTFTQPWGVAQLGAWPQTSMNLHPRCDAKYPTSVHHGAAPWALICVSCLHFCSYITGHARFFFGGNYFVAVVGLWTNVFIKMKKAADGAIRNECCWSFIYWMFNVVFNRQ